MTITPAVMDPNRTATRTDAATQVREDAAFVPWGTDKVFCVIHRPPSAPRRGVVICSSILAEQSMLHRPEVRTARVLAARGYAVIRFHYRGTGHSGGRPEAMTVASMADDARFAADTLARATGVESLVFCGARWGGVAAGLAAVDRAQVPLAVWEPVVDGGRYLPEILRAHAVRALSEQVEFKKTMTHLEREIAEAGFADVLAHPLHRALYESMPGHHLLTVARGHPRPVLFAHVHARSMWRPASASLRDTFAAAGSRVTPALITGEDPDAWSFYVEVRSTRPLIEATLGWLEHLEDVP